MCLLRKLELQGPECHYPNLPLKVGLFHLNIQATANLNQSKIKRLDQVLGWNALCQLQSDSASTHHSFFCSPSWFTILNQQTIHQICKSRVKGQRFIISYLTLRAKLQFMIYPISFFFSQANKRGFFFFFFPIR